MRYQLGVSTAILVLSMHAQASTGVDQGLPVRSGRPVVATVNRDAISLDEFTRELGPTADRARLRQGRATAKELELLDRLVTIKLVVQEAATMGLDELPEIRKQVDVSSREILREVRLERLVKDVKPDPAAVEKLFREQVRVWKTASLLFKDEGAARRAQKEIAGGAAFADVAARAVAAKAARPDSDTTYHPQKDYLPQIAEAIAALRVGQVGQVIRLQAGFVVVKVVDIRYPENAEARAEARKKASSQKQLAVLAAHEQALKRDYAVVNKAVLKSIDYEAPKPGFDALLKDKRVVVEIKGAAPVTVGDLTDYLRMQFFHGSDQARQRKEMNAKKEAALDATLGRRLLNMEALKLGIDKTNEYRDRVKGYKESLVFDSFVQKVIVPDSKMKEEEVRGYYKAHLKEYSYPEMMKVRSLAFARRAAAENAMRKLREGTDYGWLAANAEGQVDKGAQGVLTLDGRPVLTSSMPEGVQKTLAGSKSGESRLYASPEGHFYVLAVQQVIASNARPYDEVREEIAKKLYGEKLKKNVEDYAAKLRAHSKVATYLKRVA
jgi:hypothetical protein